MRVSVTLLPVVRHLLPLPADAVFRVFEENALGEEVVADSVGAGEVALLFGEGAVGDQGIDLGVGKGEGGEEIGVSLVEAAFSFGPGEGGAGVFGVAVVEDGEDLIEEVEDGEDLDGVAAAQGPVVGGGVGGADEIEDSGAGFGGVEVVGEGRDVDFGGAGGGGFDCGVDAFGEGGGSRRRSFDSGCAFAQVDSVVGGCAFAENDRLCGSACALEHASVKGAEAVDGVGGGDEVFEGEVELVAVGDADEQEADGGGAVAAQEEVAEGMEVALGLGHLPAFDEEEADVHPVAGEGLAGGALGLGDLVFVVREHEVFAAGVEVEVLSEEPGGHGGALDVPAGAAVTERGIPGGLIVFDGFPEGEVTGGILFVLVEVDACPILDVVEVFLGELAVAGITGEAEVPGAVLGLVGDVFGGELLNEGDHLGDAIRGVGDVFRALDGEGVEVFEEGLLVDAGVDVDGEIDGGRVADDLVIDVGDVHDVLRGDALLMEETAEDVDMEKGAEVADVAVVVDRGAAAVHAEGGGADGREGLDGAAEGVEQIECRHVAWGALPQPRARCSGWGLLR